MMLKKTPFTDTCKTFRFETISISNPDKSYSREKNYIRIVEVHYLESKNQYSDYQILVVDFNFSNDDNAEGILIKQISYVFDELVLTLDEDGNIVKIGNLDFLRQRWKQISDKLSQSHKGETISNYFTQIDDLLENETDVIEFLSGYNMFGLLFNGLLSSFKNKKNRISPEKFTEILNIKEEGEKTILKIHADSLENTEISHFEGILKYRNSNYEEGFVAIKKHNFHLKHSLLWIG